MAAVTICSDLGAPQNKVTTVSTSICHEVMGPDAMIFIFWMLSFKPKFSLSYFTFIKRLFSSSSLSAIRVVPSAYLRLLIFLPAILIPAYASSSPAFLMMYSAYKLNKQGDNIQPWRTPFPIWNQSIVPCPVLTVASWPAYRFLKRQVRWSGIPISWRIFQFIVIHTIKGFGIVNKAEIDVYDYHWSTKDCSQFIYNLLLLYPSPCDLPPTPKQREFQSVFYTFLNFKLFLSSMQLLLLLCS